jgi:hypothetical protein
MAINAAQAGHIQDLLGKDLAIGNHHKCIGLKRSQFIQGLRIFFDLDGLPNLELMIYCELLDGRGNELIAATPTFIGLGHHPQDIYVWLI